jgi:hemolysin III
MFSNKNQPEHTSERFNSLTHMVGLVAAVVAGGMLIWATVMDGALWKYVSSLVALYTTSTLYHATTGIAKKVFQKLDHIAIYMLIAGSYTPFLLVEIEQSVGWPIFAVVWTLAIAGIIIELLPGKRQRVLAILMYFAMSYAISTYSGSVLADLPHNGLFWLLLGGIFYTGGVVFYVMDKKFRYAHAIWHLFVLAGSASHYVVIFSILA